LVIAAIPLPLYRIADIERAEADVAAVVPEHPFVIDDGSETRTTGGYTLCRSIVPLCT
jgi:hypothetical protein